MNKWRNAFHNTEALSTLDWDSRLDVEYGMFYREVSGAEHKKLWRLEKALCGNKSCCCGGFDLCNEEERGCHERN